MDETAYKAQVQGESNEESKKNEEYSGNTNNYTQRSRHTESNNKIKRNRSRMQVTSQERQKRHSRSRSRSPHYTKHNQEWISSNAFINFIQDFRKNFVGMKSTNIYQLAGKRWRTMSTTQKQPYVNAALNIKNKRQIQQNLENMKQSGIKTKENPKNTDKDRQENVNKYERNKRKPSISSKKRTKSKSESDSDSIASRTTGSNASDDISDDSS